VSDIDTDQLLNESLVSVRAIHRAIRTARRIADAPVSITVYRDGVELDAQTVRIDRATLTTKRQGADNNVSIEETPYIVTGYKDHPTIDDTDIERGDRFEYESVVYSVVDVQLNLSGRLQARAVAQN
jgi:hypothetical protein